jgi:peptide/nickel transport system substrate-binding protein
MDARAVKYSFDRLITRGTTGATILNANNGAGFVTAVEAPNPTTVIIRLKTPYLTYPDAVTQTQLGIVNPRVVEANGGVDKSKPNPWMASHSAGGGPYLLESYVPGRRAVLVANPRYYGPKPRERRVIVNIVPSDSTLLFQATAGQADVTIGLTKQSVASLRGNRCCKIVANTVPIMNLLMLPTTRAPFTNRTFRQALAHAIPYPQIVKSVMYGYAQTFNGPYPPAFSNFNRALGKPRAYDLARAKRMIEASGVSLPVDVDLMVRQGDNDFANAAVIVKEVWRQLGVNVNIKTLVASEYIAARNTLKKDFAIMVQWGAAIGDPYWSINYQLRCGYFTNVSNYCNPAVEALIDRVRDAPVDKRQPLYDQIARLFVQDQPLIPIYSAQYVAVLKRGVRTYHWSARELPLWKWGR